MRIIRLSALVLTISVVLVGCGGPLIVSTYESADGCCGRFPVWLVPHSGVDFSGRYGEPVIAPADGIVVEKISNDSSTCGNGLAIYHRPFALYTVYCHFESVAVSTGQEVKRGDLIGRLGDSGVAGDCRRIRACPIVHMELTRSAWGHPRAEARETFDALKISIGCFDPAKTYPTDRLALTYPVRCKD